MAKLSHTQATFVSPSRFAVEKNKTKKIMTIAQLFVLQANAVSREQMHKNLDPKLIVTDSGSGLHAHGSGNVLPFR